MLNAVASSLLDLKRHNVKVEDLGQYLIDRAPSATQRYGRNSSRDEGGITVGGGLKTNEAKRWGVVLSKDYVYACTLLDELKKSISQCQTVLGKQNVDAAMAKAESSTMQILKSFGQSESGL